MLCLSPLYLRDFKQPWTKWGYSNYVLDVSYAQFLLDFKLLYTNVATLGAKRECSTEPVSPSWGSQTLDRYEVWACLTWRLPYPHVQNIEQFATFSDHWWSARGNFRDFRFAGVSLKMITRIFIVPKRSKIHAKHENLNSTNSQHICLKLNLYMVHHLWSSPLSHIIPMSFNLSKRQGWAVTKLSTAQRGWCLPAGRLAFCVFGQGEPVSLPPIFWMSMAYLWHI